MKSQNVKYVYSYNINLAQYFDRNIVNNWLIQAAQLSR